MLALAIFFIRDTVFRPKPDLTIIFATTTYVSQRESEALKAALERKIGDFNGDGRVLVSLDEISLPISAMIETAGGNADGESAVNFTGADPEMMQASSMKLMAVIAAGSDPLFLLDDGMYAYISGMSGPSPEDYESKEITPEIMAEYAIFEPMPDIPGSFGPFGDRLAIKDTVLAADPELERIGELAFSVRPALASNKKNAAYQAFCVQALKLLASGQ